MYALHLGLAWISYSLIFLFYYFLGLLFFRYSISWIYRSLILYRTAHASFVCSNWRLNIQWPVTNVSIWFLAGFFAGGVVSVRLNRLRYKLYVSSRAGYRPCLAIFVWSSPRRFCGRWVTLYCWRWYQLDKATRLSDSLRLWAGCCYTNSGKWLFSRCSERPRFNLRIFSSSWHKSNTTASLTSSPKWRLW